MGCACAKQREDEQILSTEKVKSGDNREKAPLQEENAHGAGGIIFLLSRKRREE
jgi:hypothetical protein